MCRNLAIIDLLFLPKNNVKHQRGKKKNVIPPHPFCHTCTSIHFHFIKAKFKVYDGATIKTEYMLLNYLNNCDIEIFMIYPATYISYCAAI